MTAQRKRELREQLEGIEKNGGAEGTLAGIVRELLEELGPTKHAEGVEALSREGMNATRPGDIG